MKADLIALAHENFPENQDLTIFDPIATWKEMHLTAGEFRVRELLQPIFTDGQCVYSEPTVLEICEYAARERDSLWDEHKRLIRPQIMPVDLSKNLYELKRDMIAKLRKR
jgi:nicotinate phosphoribosyltransferase